MDAIFWFHSTSYLIGSGGSNPPLGFNPVRESDHSLLSNTEF